MRKSQSASISPSKRGNGNRLGVRTRKKHKRLDAISEDVFNRNRGVKLESNEGNSRGEPIENDSELRRSSRARRAPVILDSSPPPARKRRKLDKLGEKIHENPVKKLKGKGKVKNEAPPWSSANSEEELRAWSLRLRTRRKSGSLSLIGSRDQPRGKRKLVWDGEEEINSLRDDTEDDLRCLDTDKSRVLKSTEPDSDRASIDAEDELHDDHLVDSSLENEAYTSGSGGEGECEGDGESTPSTSGRIVNEENVDGSPAHFAEKECEGLKDIQQEEKLNRIDNVEGNEQTYEPLDSSKVIEDAEDQRQVPEVTAVLSDLAENVGNDVTKEDITEAKEKLAAVENGAKVGHCNDIAEGTPKSRVKKGRRCGLCGGGIDGRPPKIMANDSAGSDNDAYSGSSASEEFSYDPWDGFGDEPGWLGRLLGPINDRYGIAGIWVHQHCAVWSPEVYFAGLGCLKNIRAALCRGRALKCTRCGRPGATLGCRVDRCPRTYHLPCARASGCIFDHRKFLIACADHRYLFQPHGYQYAQRIKKLKAKKMKMEIRKQSNDASRKDLEAEEKWLERCGEDEEFLRRETKRLQRDLLRIAPVYIGGPQSGDENPFEGWESVAGLQGVIQCMKEVVILPLLYPEFFENMGITPPRGVLLHGYPGTGKTLVVRALIGSCARGHKRIAYFARKGADCLGKYVGDAERQLRLLFQVAEKSQPSIIFFDEIDGLAPVRTRQQDQTHSSVVSTLLALMDGLKSRGSVIVIGATNRPDSVDPALRRPGRFDREIYFPLPSMKDRAAILALHTRKWPKPVSGSLLEWVAARTVGFAGADLQALCAQAAVIALKRNCCWNQILSYAGDNSELGRLPKLPSFVVEERDWLEALSLAPPPCSRREAGMAANEVLGFPLHIHLIPFLLQPLLSLIISLCLDGRLWLPRRLVNSGLALKKVVVSFMEKKGLRSDKWWCHAQDVARDPDVTKEIVRNLFIAGILDGYGSANVSDLSIETSFDNVGSHPFDFDFNSSGSLRNLSYAPSKKTGYRILISGNPRSGQKHLAACLLHCFVGSIEIQKIDLATISQEGHGDMEQGISHILMRCSSLKMCALFMPRIDLWAIQSRPSVQEDVEVSTYHQSFKQSLSSSCQLAREKCSPMQNGSELFEVTEYQDEICCASQIWKSFVEQLECTRVSSSLIILATSELPSSSLPQELRQFFGSELLTSEGSVLSGYGTPRFPVEVEGEFDRDKLINSSSLNLSRDLIQQFVQLVHIRNHYNSDKRITDKAHHGCKSDMSDLKAVEEPRAKPEVAESFIPKLPVPCTSRNGKGKSSLILAITAFGYQILRFPHFAELCWVTSKLKEGPSTDIRGPWKGWPFNSCIVRPCKSMAKETFACNTNNTKGKDQFTLVRGLIAVGLSAYRGIYTSATEVSLEVRKVLELLIGQIASRIQGGKDRYQYIRILSQVAYIEDMVKNWSHSLRSLEPDAQIIVNSKLNSAQSPERLQPAAAECMQAGDEPAVVPEPGKGGVQGSSAGSPAHLSTPGANPMQVEEELNMEGSAFKQPELEEVLQEMVAESSQPTDSNLKSIDVVTDNLMEAVNLDEEELPQKFVATNPITSSTCSAGEISNQENSSPEKVLLGSNAVSDSAFIDSVIDQCGQSVPELLVETEISPAAGKCESDVQPEDSKTSERDGWSSESEVICCYSCCIACINSILQLVKKIVSQEWKLSSFSSSRCTMEDVHDLVSTLSSSLCSSIRNLYVTEGDSSSKNGKLEPQEIITNQGEISDNSKLANLKECSCHSGQDSFDSVHLSPDSEPEYSLTFIFRDGVLVSANLDKESTFHCKYHTLCLSSLIQFIVVGFKQSLDDDVLSQ